MSQDDSRRNRRIQTEERDLEARRRRQAIPAHREAETTDTFGSLEVDERDVIALRRANRDTDSPVKSIEFAAAIRIVKAQLRQERESAETVQLARLEELLARAPRDVAEEIRRELKALSRSHADLSEHYDDLSAAHDSLSTQHNALRAQHAALAEASAKSCANVETLMKGVGWGKKALIWLIPIAISGLGTGLGALLMRNTAETEMRMRQQYADNAIKWMVEHWPAPLSPPPPLPTKGP